MRVHHRAHIGPPQVGETGAAGSRWRGAGGRPRRASFQVQDADVRGLQRLIVHAAGGDGEQRGSRDAAGDVALRQPHQPVRPHPACNGQHRPAHGLVPHPAGLRLLPEDQGAPADPGRPAVPRRGDPVHAPEQRDIAHHHRLTGGHHGRLRPVQQLQRRKRLPRQNGIGRGRPCPPADGRATGPSAAGPRALPQLLAACHDAAHQPGGLHQGAGGRQAVLVDQHGDPLHECRVLQGFPAVLQQHPAPEGRLLLHPRVQVVQGAADRLPQPADFRGPVRGHRPLRLPRRVHPEDAPLRFPGPYSPRLKTAIYRLPSRRERSRSRCRNRKNSQGV